MSNEGGAGQLQVQLQWLNDAGAVPSPVNQFLIQGGPDVLGNGESDTFILTMGHVTPPALPAFSSQEEADAFSANLAAFVVPVARLSFTPNRLRELHHAIGQVLGLSEQR